MIDYDIMSKSEIALFVSIVLLLIVTLIINNIILNWIVFLSVGLFTFIGLLRIDILGCEFK